MLSSSGRPLGPTDRPRVARKPRRAASSAVFSRSLGAPFRERAFVVCSFVRGMITKLIDRHVWTLVTGVSTA